MQTLIINRGDRHYQEIDSLVIIFAALAVSMDYKTNGQSKYNPGDYIVIEGLSSAQMIQLPIYGPIETVIANKKPDVIEITIEDFSPLEGTDGTVTSSLKDTFNYICSPFFLAFYEKNYSIAQSKYGSNYSNWPASWRMGWVVRNALAHNGKIHFRDMTTQPINWKNASVSPADQGVALESILNFTDILILLFDMENDLNL